MKNMKYLFIKLKNPSGDELDGFFLLYNQEEKNSFVFKILLV